MRGVERFRRNLLTACTVYDRRMETPLIDAWWEACADLSDERFEAALAEVIKEAERFPAPAAVRAAAHRLGEERATRPYGDDTPVPGAALLAAGAHQPCPRCRDMRFVRAEAAVGEPHFSAAIPCPRCRGAAYDRYVERHGAP